MNFWYSEFGEITGNNDDAFNRGFGLIPNGTMALAKIDVFKHESFQSENNLKIEWILTDGDFKGQRVFHKIKVFDQDPKARHKALNMLMLIYKLFNKIPSGEEPPTPEELKTFTGKIAGIKIMETKPNDDGKIYNFVGEVHPANGFKSMTGEPRILSQRRNSSNEELTSALTRQRQHNPIIDDDIPFF